MKKILLSFLFLLALFCFPFSVYGAVMEMTVTITTLTIPERSAIRLESDKPNTEFAFAYSRITVVRASDSAFMAKKLFDTAYITNAMQKNAVVTFAFPYDSTLVYKVYAESQANAQSTYIAYKADCTPVPANTGYYLANGLFYYNRSSVNASCPNPPFNGDLRTTIFLDSTHVYRDSTEGNQAYWRSPALFTVTGS